MIKKGFTLTEVLITLGVIGILAAITIPRLFNNTQDAHLGAQFATAISTIETGAGMYLYDKGIKNTNYISGGMTPSGMLAALAGKYIKMSVASNPKGSIDNSITLGTCYTLPDKSLICSTDKNDTLVAENNGSANSELAFISSKSINQKALIEGFDFFRVSMSAEGLLFIPGLDYDTGATCDPDTGGKGCAGVVAKNGWKVKYN